MGYVNKTYLSTQFKNFADKIAKVFSKIGHKHVKSDITDFPTSMPANGGNAATVGGHTVGVNVPSNAKFTDTTYSKLSEFTDDVGYVKDTDSRLSDARNAKDVYDWAKASTKPTYTANEVGALKAYSIQYKLPANNGGWHKIAKITNTPTPYWSFDLYATGNWNYRNKSNAHFHILNRHGTVIIEQISGTVGSGIATIRTVRESDSPDVWILEEFSSNSPGEESYSFTICGDVGLTPLDGELDTNDASAYKAIVTLPVVDIPTGNNITSGNIQEQSVKHANSSDKVSHTLSIGVVKGAAQIYTFDGSQDVNFDIQIPTTASEVGALPISGGTITGTILSKKTSTSLKLTENAELICSTEGLGNLTIKESEINFSSNSGSGTLNKTNLKFSGGGTTTTYSNDSVTKKLGNNTYTLSLPSKTGTLALTSDIVNTSTIVNLIYPVGSIYMSVNNVNPSTFLGGTWEAWGSGQVPVGVNPNDSDFSTAEKTGGSKSVTPSGTVGGHTLTTNEMPSHGHSISIPASGACTTDSQGNHQHKTNATFVDNAVRLSSEHNTVMGWVSGWGYKSNANRGLNSKTDVSLSIYVPQLSMSTNGLHSHNVPNHAHSVTQYNAGGNGSHDHSFTGNAQSNVQPYITCYMWKRTA